LLTQGGLEMLNLAVSFLLMIFSFFAYFFSKKKLNKIGYLTSLIFSVLSLFAYPIWQYVRSGATYGLLNFIDLNEDQTQILFAILTASAFGAFFANNIFDIYRMKRDSDVQHTANLISNVVNRSKILIQISVFTFVIAILGEGTSILERQRYLGANGFLFLQKVSSVSVLPVLGILTFLLTKQISRRIRNQIYLILFFYWVFFLARGSRTAVILLFLILVANLARKAPLRIHMVRSLFIIFMTLLSFQIIFAARTNPHGLLNIPNLIEFDDLVLNSNSGIFLLISSLLSWVIVVPLSVNSSGLSVLIKNANPFFGTGLDPYAFGHDGVERLYPFSWVPVSSAGQIYGSLGYFAVFGFFFFLTLLVLSLTTRMQNYTKISLVVPFTISIYFFQIPTFLQYSSRNWFRVVWLYIFLVILSHILMTRETRNTSVKRTLSE
jgi:hypothetical protein